MSVDHLHRRMDKALATFEQRHQSSQMIIKTRWGHEPRPGPGPDELVILTHWGPTKRAQEGEEDGDD